MRKLSRFFAIKDAARGSVPRRRRKVAALATAAESSAKMAVAAPVEDLNADLSVEVNVEVTDGVANDVVSARVEGMKDDVSRLELTGSDEEEATEEDRAPDSSDDPPNAFPDVSQDDVAEADVSQTGTPFESGIYMSSSVSSRFTNADPDLVRQVTLVVYEWHSVQPGTLSWVFPSVQAALAAARAMRNAVKWAVIAGRRTAKVDVESERASGAVLADHRSLAAG